MDSLGVWHEGNNDVADNEKSTLKRLWRCDILM